MRQPLPLDDWTADRLLAGMVDPDDAPPGCAGLVRALAQTRGPVEAGELAGRELLVAAVTAAVADASPPTIVSTPLRRRSMVSRLFGTKVAAAAMTTVLLATGAAAATGSLPDTVQGIVSDAAGNVGVDLPDGTGAPEVLPVLAPDGDNQGDDDGDDDTDDQGDHDGADEVGDDTDDQGDHNGVDDTDDTETGTPASQEGVNAHIVRDLRNSDDPAVAGATDWKSVRDEFHAQHKAEHAADPAPAAGDAQTRRDEHLATLEQEKAERDALKDARPSDDADDSDDDADDQGDDVADDDDADEDDDDKGKGHEDDNEDEDDDAEDAPTAG